MELDGGGGGLQICEQTFLEINCVYGLGLLFCLFLLVVVFGIGSHTNIDFVKNGRILICHFLAPTKGLDTIALLLLVVHTVMASVSPGQISTIFSSNRHLLTVKSFHIIRYPMCVCSVWLCMYTIYIYIYIYKGYIYIYI